MWWAYIGMVCAYTSQNFVDIGLEVGLTNVGCDPEEVSVKVYIYSNQVNKFAMQPPTFKLRILCL